MKFSVALSLITIPLSLAICSCGTMGNVGIPGTSKPYIGDFAAKPKDPTITTEASPVPDNESYWDGDGVSGSPKVIIDLSDQKAYFYKGGTIVGVSRISSGTATHRTPTGNFKVTEKDVDHASSLYGEYEDQAGNVVMKEVDTRKHKRKPGWKYVGAPMKYFLRFNGGVGMHAGFLPGYAASHGCIRMPEHMARKFYENAPYGMPISVRH